MARKKTAKPKKAPLTDAERHARFVEMAHELEADDSADAFDAAFKKIVRAPPSGSRKANARR